MSPSLEHPGILSANFCDFFFPPPQLLLPPHVQSLAEDPHVTCVSPREPFIPIPQSYSGDLGVCRAFLLKCALVFEQQPLMYASGKSRISFIMGLLSGKASEWATFCKYTIYIVFTLIHFNVYFHMYYFNIFSYIFIAFYIFLYLLSQVSANISIFDNG